MCLNHQYYFPSFSCFYFGGGVGSKFAIYQYIWVIEVSGDIILGVIIEGIRVGYIRVRGEDDCKLMINIISLIFLFFTVFGGVGGKLAIFQ